MCAGGAGRLSPPPLPTAPCRPRSRRLVSAEFLDPSTILRSLILFNLLFAAQSILDGIYLWGHVALPDNLTYAAYAHRGAYPLIATALLAAAFVLVAMRPGGAAEKSKVIRPLVYLWVGQNVLLVASSILRLDLYVDIYMLTYWRIAAFIWMGLVALGLVLIVARIALNRSNQWLVGANLIALTIVLYGCSLVNFDAFIADYNVDPQPGSIGQRRADRHQLSPRRSGRRRCLPSTRPSCSGPAPPRAALCRAATAL